MKEKIIKYLKEIEKEKDFKILLACETGSRAWGFPSKDSDFDVRLIYVKPLDWHLNLNERKDTIEVFYEDKELDFSGFELRKSLRLLKKSNSAIIERIQSPIVYYKNELFVNEIMELAKTAYSKIASIHHYIGLANKYFDKVNGAAEYKLKSLFYFLRASFTCKFILENEAIVPIEFNKVLDGITLNEEIKNEILELISFKETTIEGYLHKGNSNLISVGLGFLNEAKEKANNLPSSNFNAEKFDDFFKKIVLNKNGY